MKILIASLFSLSIITGAFAECTCTTSDVSQGLSRKHVVYYSETAESCLTAQAKVIGICRRGYIDSNSESPSRSTCAENANCDYSRLTSSLPASAPVTPPPAVNPESFWFKGVQKGAAGAKLFLFWVRGTHAVFVDNGDLFSYQVGFPGRIGFEDLRVEALPNGLGWKVTLSPECTIRVERAPNAIRYRFTDCRGDHVDQMEILPF